jgi:hypothetical protein
MSIVRMGGADVVRFWKRGAVEGCGGAFAWNKEEDVIRDFAAKRSLMVRLMLDSVVCKDLTNWSLSSDVLTVGGPESL